MIHDTTTMTKYYDIYQCDMYGVYASSPIRTNIPHDRVEETLESLRSQLNKGELIWFTIRPSSKNDSTK